MDEKNRDLTSRGIENSAEGKLTDMKGKLKDAANSGTTLCESERKLALFVVERGFVRPPQKIQSAGIVVRPYKPLRAGGRWPACADAERVPDAHCASLRLQTSNFKLENMLYRFDNITNFTEHFRMFAF